MTRVERSQLASFALLGTPPEGLPATVRRILKKPVFGTNWDLAQHIPTKASGTYWLLPGNGYMCVVSDGGMGSDTIGTACALAAQARRHGIAAINVARSVPGSRVSAGRLIVGVAPNGADRVAVHTRGIATETVPVHHGVFVLHDSTPEPPSFFEPR